MHHFIILTAMATGLVTFVLTPSSLAKGQSGISSINSEVSSKSRALRLTLYHNNLALIEDHRRIALRPGLNRVELQQVSAKIMPETVGFSTPGLTLMEQNFDYDLLTPSRMMEKSIGEKIRIQRIFPGKGPGRLEPAEVLSVNEGVILRSQGKIEVLNSDALPTRVIFDKLPSNLRAFPTLSVLLKSAKSQTLNTRLTYLSKGLRWKADYVAQLEGDLLHLQGWVTLRNTTGTSFRNARIDLVAGSVNNGLSRNRSLRASSFAQMQPLEEDNQDTHGLETTIGSYRLYHLEHKTDLANAQTKQISLLSARSIPVKRKTSYVNRSFTSLKQPRHAHVYLIFDNNRKSNLGRSLPQGTVRVYERDKRRQPQFIGEDKIASTPPGVSLSLKTGQSFDITVLPVIVEQKRIGKRRWQYRMHYTLHNGGAKSAKLSLVQAGLGYNGKVLDESKASKRLDADKVEWTVRIPARSKKIVTALFETRSRY